MRILIFHGYLLRGTGSNVYNAELARAIVAAGGEVHICCQDRTPADLPFVDAVGTWDNGVLEVEVIRQPVRCTVYRPAIGNLLPVYVADRYEGFEARTFDLLTDTELNCYIDRNVAAVRDVIDRADPDMTLANHLVMGPLIVRRALAGRSPYVVKIHGSALEYIVKPHPRFLPYAREGIGAATAVLVGSRHTAESLWATLPELDLAGRTRLGPPGVDVARFAPADSATSVAALGDLALTLDTADRTGFTAAAAEALDRLIGHGESALPSGVELGNIRADYDPSGIDQLAPDSVRALNPQVDRIVSYVGKLIVSKGVDLLLAAWPLVTARVPQAKLAIVGFGAYREGLELLLRALAAGEIDRAIEIADRGRELEGGASKPLAMLGTFLAALGDDEIPGVSQSNYFEAAARMPQSVVWFGRLEHSLMQPIVAASEAQVVSSTFPEAFGMVAAEAAACGTLPICANHSGLAEVVRELVPAVSPDQADLMTFDLGPDSVVELGNSIVRWLELPAATRASVSQGLAAAARRLYSWEKVALDLQMAGRAELASLREP